MTAHRTRNLLGMTAIVAGLFVVIEPYPVVPANPLGVTGSAVEEPDSFVKQTALRGGFAPGNVVLPGRAAFDSRRASGRRMNASTNDPAPKVAMLPAAERWMRLAQRDRIVRTSSIESAD